MYVEASLVKKNISHINLVVYHQAGQLYSQLNNTAPCNGSYSDLTEFLTDLFHDSPHTLL